MSTGRSHEGLADSTTRLRVPRGAARRAFGPMRRVRGPRHLPVRQPLGRHLGYGHPVRRPLWLAVQRAARPRLARVLVGRGHGRGDGGDVRLLPLEPLQSARWPLRCRGRPSTPELAHPAQALVRIADLLFVPPRAASAGDGPCAAGSMLRVLRLGRRPMQQHHVARRPDHAPARGARRLAPREQGLVPHAVTLRRRSRGVQLVQRLHGLRIRGRVLLCPVARAAPRAKARLMRAALRRDDAARRRGERSAVPAGSAGAPGHQRGRSVHVRRLPAPEHGVQPDEGRRGAVRLGDAVERLGRHARALLGRARDRPRRRLSARLPVAAKGSRLRRGAAGVHGGLDVLLAPRRHVVELQAGDLLLLPLFICVLLCARDPGGTGVGRAPRARRRRAEATRPQRGVGRRGGRGGGHRCIRRLQARTSC